MKTKILILAIVILIIGSRSIKAENDSVYFKQSIVNKISYPEFAMKEKLGADVWVQFTVNKAGEINVDQINCVDVSFLDYVKSELQKISIDTKSNLINKTFYYRFTFKYQQE